MAKGILGFCNPAVDLCAFTEDSFLAENGLEKGKTATLTIERALEISGKIKNFTSIACGGSGLNVIRLIGTLGYEAAVIGQYGDDERRQVVVDALKKCNVKDKCILKPGGITSCIFVCISPDAQRTMFSISGASHEDYVEEVDLEQIKDYDAVLFEGYQVCNTAAVGLVDRASAKAKELGKKSVFVVSGVFDIPGYRENILRMIPNFTIITGNLEEMFILFDKDNLEDLLKFLEGSHFELVAVTLGEQGSWLVHKGKSSFFPAPKVDKVVDTTGAGDSFTGGLVYGYLKGYSLEKSAEIASYVAGRIISQVGFVFDSKLKDEVDAIVG